MSQRESSLKCTKKRPTFDEEKYWLDGLSTDEENDSDEEIVNNNKSDQNQFTMIESEIQPHVVVTQAILSCPGCFELICNQCQKT